MPGGESPSAAAYGIRSIPATILVGPDGMMTDTGLRGEQLGQRLKAIYGF